MSVKTTMLQCSSQREHSWVFKKQLPWWHSRLARYEWSDSQHLWLRQPQWNIRDSDAGFRRNLYQSTAHEYLAIAHHCCQGQVTLKFEGGGTSVSKAGGHWKVRDNTKENIPSVWTHPMTPSSPSRRTSRFRALTTPTVGGGGGQGKASLTNLKKSRRPFWDWLWDKFERIRKCGVVVFGWYFENCDIVRRIGPNHISIQKVQQPGKPNFWLTNQPAFLPSLHDTMFSGY
jgi:hypothetical protein